jgi:hypothetical protein
MSKEKEKNKAVLNIGEDEGVKVELVVNDRAEAAVLHSKPFSKELSWLEFDLDSNKLDFILEDGELRTFGIPVHPDLSKYLQNAFQVLMVEVDEKTGDRDNEHYMPLIIHRA